MCRLQSLAAPAIFCVSLNVDERLDARRVLRRFDFDHPLFTPPAVAAQRRHAEISGVDRIHYCGAYWGNGFHEDGVVSALAVTRRFGRDLDTEAAPEPPRRRLQDLELAPLGADSALERVAAAAPGERPA